MRRVLVTGGTQGIGFAVCRRFATLGDSVTAIYSRDEESARRAGELLPDVRFVRADVSDEADVRSVIGSLPYIDVLVNNAGISSFGQVQDVPWQEWERVQAVNAGGVFLCCKHAVKKLLESSCGAIVNISSVWGESGGSCESVYSASKGAVIAFTKALAKELAPSGVTVNCVTPGVIDTRMNAWLCGEERRSLIEEIPLGRFGSPEEVADAVCFLVQNRYITGQILGVNGGFCL